MQRFNFCFANIIAHKLALQIYSEELATDAALKPKLRNVLERQKATWGKLQSLMQHTLCLVNYFASVQQY